MGIALWILALVLVAAGLVLAIQRHTWWAIAFIIGGMLAGVSGAGAVA